MIELTRNSSTPSLDLEKGKTYTLLGNVLIALGDGAGARQQAIRALALIEPRSEQDPVEDNTREELARALLLWGRVQTDASAAKDAWSRALTVLEPICRDTRHLELLDLWKESLQLLARQEEANSLQERIDELRKEVASMETALGRGA